MEAVQQQARSLQLQLPSLEAPSLTGDLLSLSKELINERATEAHWGSKAIQESLAEAQRLLAAQQQQVPGAAAVTDALSQVQAAVAGTADQLAHLPEQASGAELEQLAGAQQQLASKLQQLAAAAAAAAGSVAVPGPGAAAPSLSSQLGDLATAEYAGYSLQTLGAVAGGVAALVALSVPRQSDDDPPGGSSGGSGSGSSSSSSSSGRPDVLPTSWDPEAVAQYYRRRPVLVARRMVEVAGEAAAWGAAVLVDMASGTVEVNAGARADEGMTAIERLGPAYVKVAQAMSTRVDLLPPPYLLAIQRLQDRVPPFGDDVAYACIEGSFGAPVSQVFSYLSPRAVAAASLGQVYRGTLRATGRDVAIKVRRPGVLDSVSLDLHLMRAVALQLRDMPEVKSDWVGIIDAWAARFLEEMDYGLEAANTQQFARDLAHMPGVVIPDVVPEGTSSSVLVLGWVEGERLTDSSASDVRQLCSTLLSAYLHQLTDTGLLHADPHPGNLLRTPDGRIAILDHGLVQEIPADYMVALLEYIAHLSVGDWDSLADDLVHLGFVDSVEDKSQLVGPLAAILTQLTAGGGARKVNIAVVMEEIEKMTQVYDFRIPPIFALILRTFSVIEGIALQADPDYSIVKECLPFLSKRLLTDDNPRTRAALKQLLFAGQDHISLQRLELLAGGVSRFTVDGLRGQAPTGGAAVASAAQPQPQPLLDGTSREILAAVFSDKPGGSYIQELLVEEAVATVDAAGRQLAAMLLQPALGNLAAVRAAVASGGQLGTTQLPPAVAMLTRLPALVELSPEDQQQLATARGVVALLQAQQAQAPPLTPQQAQQLVAELAPLAPQLLPGVLATGDRFVRALAKRSFDRLAAAAGVAPPPDVDSGYRAMEP